MEQIYLNLIGNNIDLLLILKKKLLKILLHIKLIISKGEILIKNIKNQYKRKLAKV